MTLAKLLDLSGLTKYQSELFVAIIKNPESTAKSLSRISKVPLGRIYTELESLEKKGLVDSVGQFPKKYTIDSPQEKILNLVEAEKDKLEAIERKAFEEFVSFNKKSAEVYYSTPEIRQSQIDSFRWAQFEVCQCLGNLHKPSESRDLKAMYEKEIVSAVKKGTIFRALYQKGQVPPKNLLLLQEQFPKTFHIRYSAIKLPRFDVIDDNQILLKIQDPEDSSVTLGTVVINNIALARKVKSRFMQLWDVSE